MRKFWLLILLAFLPLLAVDTLTLCDFSGGQILGATLVGNLASRIDSENRRVVLEHEQSINKGVSGGVSVPFVWNKGGVLVGEADVTIGNCTPSGHGQVSGRLYINFSDAQSKAFEGIVFGSARYHRDRYVAFNFEGDERQVPFNFTPGEKMKVRIILNRTKLTWRGEVFKGAERMFTTEEQSAQNFIPTQFRVVAATVNKNDGMTIFVGEPVVRHYSQKEFTEFEAASAKQEYCSTMPRQYKNVNPELYNSGFANFSGANNSDRIALADKAAAEARAKELADLGFSAVLYSGRHFRVNYLDDHSQIDEAGRIVREACAKYGISVIEHHDPTIINYRAYPYMFFRRNWLQRDIRDGSSNFWFCPGNEDFMAYLLRYLRTFQSKARFAGFMIDELNLSGRDFDGCDSCRAAYEAETGEKAPYVLNHAEPPAAQRKFRSWGMRMTSNRNNEILNTLQEIKPDTILMTYCSDYADPISQVHDLTEAAAMYSPFVGWENMIYGALDSATSFLTNLKMRNSYGDFYNSPTWSLNRESIVKEAHYLSWAFCQGARHAIWYGRVPLATPEDKAYFKSYSCWSKIMPHRYARTFTDTAVLLSLQTWRTTTDRNFYWYDFLGTVNTYIRSNRQFDTLLDGDLFYPGRRAKYTVLVLPSQASLSNTQCATIENFVKDGGTVVLTNHTSLHDEHGYRRHDFRLGKAMNLRWTDKTFGKGKVSSKIAGTASSFDVPNVHQVEIVDGGKSNVLAEYTAASGERLPLVVETPYGKGRFLYLAAQYGTFVYELEMRNGRAYNYRPNPPLAALINALYDEAHRGMTMPAAIEFPEKVVGIANQLQDGEGRGNIYVQMFNLTGASIKPGERKSYGVPENLSFPEIKGDMKVSVSVPCSIDAVLESPERGDIAVKGVKSGGKTVFTIPGNSLGIFAQLKVTGAEPVPEMKILEPPMAMASLKKPKIAEKDEDWTPLYEAPKLEGVISKTVDMTSAKGIGMTADDVITIDGKPLIVRQFLRQANHEYKDFVREDAFAPTVKCGWTNGDAKGQLASGKLFNGMFPYVREFVRHSADKMELSMAGTLLPADHKGAYCIWTFCIPVEMLKGAKGAAYVGMHRSGRPLKTFTVKGDEPDGAIVCDSIRTVQFTGGPVDFSVDFAPMGPWGLYIEDLSSQYKAHLIREGGYYCFVLPANDVRYGIQYTGKVILRTGVTDIDNLHPQKYMQYQTGSPVSMRLQFADGPLATGFKKRDGFKNLDQEFVKADMSGWSKPAKIKVVDEPKTAPVYYSGAVGSGDNSFSFAHENCIALLNLIINGKGGAVEGTVRANGGKPNAFKVASGDVETILIPVWIKDGKVKLDFTGDWMVTGIVMQPMLYPTEDYIFSRSYWNCGVCPWLLPELKCEKNDWRLRSDLHLRKAKWEY